MEMMSKVTFPQLLSIYRHVEFNSQATGGKLVLSSEGLRDTLVLLLNDANLDDSGISLISGDPDNLIVGQTVEIQLESPRIGLGILTDDLDGLLKTRKAHVEERKNYYIINSKYAQGDLVVPSEICEYKNIISFIGLLKEAAAYLDVDKEELIFIHEGKFTLPVNYSTADLHSTDFSAIDRIKESLISDIHKEQKLAIFSDAVISLVKGVQPEKRFHMLLSNLPELQLKFADGYRLFISNFSYDKIRNELEIAKVEYSGKIHKVFTDIQNQVLGIPIATVVIATQMKDSTTENASGYEFLVNLAVLLGCWIFVVLVGLLIWNQLHTLEVLSSEISRQKDLIKEKHHAVALNFDDIFEMLDRRLELQKIILKVIVGVLGVGLFLAHMFYFYLTPVTWLW